MKKIISIFLSFSIVFLSVLTCIPISVCADTDKTVLSKSSDSPFAYSSSEAQKYVSAHLDIYDSDNTLLFSYTPTSTYNWTYSAKGKDNLHLSDNQLKAFLMSKKTLSAYAQLMFSGFSNNNVTRGFLSALGIATTGNSNALTDVSDKLLGNYNYIDSINYDEDTQTITMDNTSVDKLRKEIKDYYLDSIGAGYMANSYELNSNKPLPAKAIENIHSSYEYEDDYLSDFNAANQYDYTISASSNNVVLGFDKSFSYAYLDESLKYNGWSTSFGLYFVNENLEIVKPDFHLFNPKSLDIDMNNIKLVGGNGLGSTGGNLKYFDVELYTLDNSKICGIHYYQGYSYFFTNKNVNNTLMFKSYSALYNYVHGDQNAYLSSQINKIGEDISFSIKDMNENLGEKMDTLIDTINDKKGSMSADELQNAIDKGLADLNKNTEDIKDNTQEMNSKLDSILEALNAQNQTLLAILGVTKKIADTVDDIDEKTDYNSIVSTISTIFNAVQCALLYGQNTLKDSNSSAQAQAVSYSDDIAVYSDSGGTYKPKVLNMDLRSGIFGHFPFSMIYHMYDWCAAFVAEAKAPVFTYNYGFLVGDKDNPELTVSIDLSQYEDWRDAAVSFMKLAFTLAVAFGSYKRFKEVML